jgi:hypothetical protein
MDNTTTILLPDAPPGSATCSGSAIRPHEEQTTLEIVLRSHLWYPNDIIARGKVELQKCVKAKEYQEAADWEKLISKAEREVKDWTYILELYEQERKSPNKNVGPAVLNEDVIVVRKTV